MSLKTQGAKLEYGNTADYSTATTWTEVARVSSIKPPKRSAKDITVTVLASTAEEKEPGLPSTGDLEAKLEYDKVRAGTLDGFFNVAKAWRVRYSDDSGRQFNGWISELGEEELKNGDIITQMVKLTVTQLDDFAADLTA
jgi:hypothetical protein